MGNQDDRPVPARQGGDEPRRIVSPLKILVDLSYLSVDYFVTLHLDSYAERRNKAMKSSCLLIILDLPDCCGSLK